MSIIPPVEHNFEHNTWVLWVTPESIILHFSSIIRQALSRSVYHLNGIFGSFFWTNGTALFSTKETTSASSFFPYDVAQAEARWNPASCTYKKRKTQVPTTKLNSFSPAGLQLCFKTSAPTLPTSKDTHCNDKRFGNLPSSFRSLVFGFLGSITVKSLVL